MTTAWSAVRCCSDSTSLFDKHSCFFGFVGFLDAFAVYGSVRFLLHWGDDFASPPWRTGYCRRSPCVNEVKVMCRPVCCFSIRKGFGTKCLEPLLRFKAMGGICRNSVQTVTLASRGMLPFFGFQWKTLDGCFSCSSVRKVTWDRKGL